MHKLKYSQCAAWCKYDVKLNGLYTCYLQKRSFPSGSLFQPPCKDFHFHKKDIRKDVSKLSYFLFPSVFMKTGNNH